MSFTLVASGVESATAVTTDDTDSVTPALGDIAFFGMHSTDDTVGHSCTGGGMTWTLVRLQAFITGSRVATFGYEAVSGTPSAGALTFSKTDSFTDMGWALVRPSGYDPTPTGNGNGTGSGNDITITITDGPWDGLLTYGYVSAVTTYTKDGDASWIELLDENAGTGGSQQIQYRLSDDSEVLIDPGSDPETIAGMCLKFTTAAAGWWRRAHQWRGL